MADATIDGTDASPKRSRMGLIIGALLALIGGAGGFAVTSGLMPLGLPASPSDSKETTKSVAFIPVAPMTVSIGSPSESRYLKFRAELEVSAKNQPEVSKMMPRIVDVLNTYLRSITMADVEDPAALLTLRSQMRRRVDLIVGGDKIVDLLVMEFVVN